MAHSIHKNRLRHLSDDEFTAFLYRLSDSYGFLQPHQMLEFGVVVTSPLTVTDFLEFFSFALLTQ
jgi:hypothetical protein